MIFLQPAFLLFALITVLIADARPRGLAPAAMALVVNLAFIGLFLGWQQGAILLGFSLLGFVLLRLPRATLTPAVALTLAVFVMLKKYEFLPAAVLLENLPVAIGLSYVLFRLLHLLVDRAQSEGPAPGLVEHLEYTLAAHSLLSGPFQRYEEHAALLAQAPRHAPEPQMARIADGFLKVVLLAPLFKSGYAAAVPGFEPGLALGLSAFVHTIAAALFWLVFMYFNFSGYMDIVIGWARLCRLDLPENFDRPWLADGFLDFWSRWHMTMTGWFKAYVFTPLMVALGRHLPPTRAMSLAASAFAFFVTFLLVGAWHGPAVPFITCGLFLGIGATVNQLAREWTRLRRKAKGAAAMPRSDALRLFGAGFNLIYIALAVSPFWLDDRQFGVFLRAFTHPANLLLALPLCSAMMAVGLVVLRISFSAAVRAWGTRANWWSSPAAIGARCTVLLLCVLSSGAALPDFVYKGI